MLPKKYRLTKRENFKRLRKGITFYSPIAIFKVLQNNLNISRFGIVVGAKVTRKAVKRNKLRRQINEIIRLKLPSLKSGYDVLILALPKIIEKNYWEINEEVDKVFKKAGIYKD
jgi:ribonuclease P protein component